MNFLSLTDVCTNSNVLRVMLFLINLIRIIFFAVPIGLIVMTSVDLAKNVITSKEDEMKKNVNVAIKRIIMAVVIFFIQPIVSFAINGLGDNGVEFTKCITNATKENIKYYESLEKEEKEIEEGSRIKQETSDIISTPSSSTTPGSGGSNDTSTPSGNYNEYAPKPNISNLKLYKTRTIYAVGGTAKGSQQKVQQFAITDIGTDNEIIWYAYQVYQNDNAATHISAYNKNDKRVYAAYIKYGGEGQSFDVVKKSNNTYTIYTGASAVNDNSTGRPKSVYSYNVTPDSKYSSTYDNLDFSNKGFSIGKTNEASYDPNTKLLLIKTGGYNVKIYSYDDSKELTNSNANQKYSFTVTQKNSGNGSDLSGNYMYYVEGMADFKVGCYDITTGKEVYYTSFNNVMNKVKEVCSQCTGNNGEIEGIKIYTYNGKKRIFIGYKAGSYKNSAILYFDY